VDNCLILKGVLHNNFILFTGTQINMLISNWSTLTKLTLLSIQSCNILVGIPVAS
jgi:hypothetical protein